MGREIVYCAGCQTQLRGSEFEKQKAYRLEGQAYCEGCARDLIATLPEERINSLLALFESKQEVPPGDVPPPAPEQVGSRTTRIMQVLASTGFHRTVAPGTRRAESRSNGSHLVWIAAGAGLLLLAVVAVAARGGRDERRPAPTSRLETEEPPVVRPSSPDVVPPAPVRRAGTPSEVTPKSGLAAARDFAAKNPQDLERQIALYEGVLWERGDAAQTAQVEGVLKDLRARLSARLSEQLAPVEAAARKAAEAGDFKSASESIARARRLRPEAEWGKRVDRLQSEVSLEIDKTFARIKERAVEAAKKGSLEDVRGFQERVGTWGRPDLTASLASALSAVPAAAPPSDPAAAARQTCAAMWEEAFDLAAARDYGAAARALGEASTSAPDEGLRKELLADAEAFRFAGRLVEEVQTVLAQWPKGKKLGLHHGDGARTEEAVLRVGSGGVEFQRGKEVVVVPLADIASSSLAEIYAGRSGTRREADARVAALFLIFEGDLDGAKRWSAGLSSPIPDKYWARASRRAAELGRPDSELARREAEARGMLGAANALHANAADRAEAAVAYQKLLNDHGRTRAVGRCRTIVAERIESAKHYAFHPAELVTVGAWRPAAWKKASFSLTKEGDTDPSARASHYLEMSFGTLPDLEYRVWIQAGACCPETLVLHVQSNALTSDPAKRESAVAEPGSAVYLPLKPAAALLKTHANHGLKKDPVRWEWATFALPKSAAGGPRTLRVAGDFAGLSVGWVMVSAVRKTPLTEAEMKEADKPRSFEALEGRLAQGLIGYWKMDEGTGETVADSSGRGGAGSLKNGPTWVEGRSGKALRFDGDDDYFECPNSEALTPRKEMTVSLWLKCLSDPAEWDGVIMKSDKDWLTGFGLWFRGGTELRFFVGHWEQQTLSATIQATQWNHVTGVYDGQRMRLFVNAKEAASRERGGDIPPTSHPLIVGRAVLTGSAQENTLAAEIDDVRLYGRALNEEEVRALATRRGR